MSARSYVEMRADIEECAIHWREQFQRLMDQGDYVKAENAMRATQRFEAMLREETAS